MMPVMSWIGRDLISQLYLPEAVADEFFELLIKLKKIDRELWEESKILWCQNLVNNLVQVYAKRGRKLPSKPLLETEKAISGTEIPNSGAETTHSRVEYSREEKSKEILSSNPADLEPQVQKRFSSK